MGEFDSLFELMAKDIAPRGGRLTCDICNNRVNVTIDDVEHYLQTGWLRCCGRTMRFSAFRDVWEDVRTERKRQDEMWPEQNHPLSKWLTILMEEVGEAATAVNQLNDSPCINIGKLHELRTELIHAAAVAIAAAEFTYQTADEAARAMMFPGEG